MLSNCLFIFIIRIIETMLNTFRTILIIKNNKKLAVIVAFFEIIIWLTAIKRIVSSEFDIYGAIAYAFGFSLGTYIGMLITDNFSKEGTNFLVVLPFYEEKTIHNLKQEGYNFLIEEVYDQSNNKKYKLTINVEKSKVKEFRQKKMFKNKEIEIKIVNLKKV